MFLIQVDITVEIYIIYDDNLNIASRLYSTNHKTVDFKNLNAYLILL